MESDKIQKKKLPIKSKENRENKEKREKKIDIGYIRVVGIKKDKEIFQQIAKKYENIPLSSGSSSIMHLFSGEKKEV